MKSEINCSELVIVPLPQTIISVRDKNDRNNALDVGYVTNVSHDPAMAMVGIESIRFSNMSCSSSRSKQSMWTKNISARTATFCGTKWI